MATTIPQRELRNDVSSVLRRVEAGEEFIVTVSGRPVAQLRAVNAPEKGSVAAFVAALRQGGPPSAQALAQLARLDEQLRQFDDEDDDRDPWEQHR